MALLDIAEMCDKGGGDDSGDSGNRWDRWDVKCCEVL